MSSSFPEGAFMSKVFDEARVALCIARGSEDCERLAACAATMKTSSADLEGAVALLIERYKAAAGLTSPGSSMLH